MRRLRAHCSRALRAWPAGLAAGVIALFAAASAPQAQVCLAPEQLTRVLGEESLRRPQRAHRRLARNAGASEVCRRQAGRLCPARGGLYALWSNNAAAYWVGPLIGGRDELAHVESRLARLSAIAREVAGGDYAGAAAGPVALRRGECVHAHDTAGAVDPQLLYAIGRESMRLEEASAALGELLARLRERPPAGGELPEKARETAEGLVEAAFAPAERSASEGAALGRAGDGLLHWAADGGAAAPVGGGAGGGPTLSSAFARWIARVTAAAAGGEISQPVRGLALTLYLRRPGPFNELAAHAAPPAPPEDAADPSRYFDALAAVDRAHDARLRFRDAWSEEGGLTAAMTSLRGFAESLPRSLRARFTGAGEGELFGVETRSSPPELPEPDELESLTGGEGGLRAITEQTDAAARELGRAGLTAAARRLAADSGAGFDPARVSDALLAGEPARLASIVLRSLLTQAFAGDAATMRHIDALTAGAFDSFAGALLADRIEARLTGAGAGDFDAESLRAAGNALVSGAPAQAYGGLTRAATADFAPAWRRGIGALLDGRVGAATRSAIRNALIGEGVSPGAAERLLERGETADILTPRLAQRLGLPPAQLNALQSGEALEPVRDRAAQALGAPSLTGAALRERLAQERRSVEDALLERLDRQNRAGLDRLAALGEPAGRRALAHSLFRDRLAGTGSAAALLSENALAALLDGDRGTAMRQSLEALLSQVPGGSALVEARPEPYRRSVARALREAAAGALGEEATQPFLNAEALTRLRAGEMARLGRSYARRLFAVAGLERQTQRHLLAGEVAAAWRHEAQQREASETASPDPVRRLERNLWRAQAAVDLRRLALERRRRIYGVQASTGRARREEE